MSTQSQDSKVAGRTGLIVLGMHRSGTSALAGALGLCGAWLGENEELTDANVENPKGFWERRDVRAICDRLLHDSGADWWKVADFDESAIPQSSISEQRLAFQRVVAELETHAVWAIKEPRLCLLFRILRPVLVDPVCIHVYRNPLDVAHSLRARNGFGIAEGLALWEAYNSRALDASTGLRRLSVSYEALVSQPDKTLGTLLSGLTSLGIATLAMPTTDQIAAFITPDLRHQQHTMPDAIEFLLPSQQALWSRLQSGEALRAVPPGSPSRVVRQYLHDLESRKSSLDQVKAKAQRAGSALRRQKELAQTLETELDAYRASVKQLTSDVDKERSRAGRLGVELEASEAKRHKIAATSAYRRAELDKLSERIRASEQNRAELEARLSAVYASQSWRVTAPLRALSRAVKWVFRRVRNVCRLFFWLVTGQFGRLADVLLPRCGRYVPLRIRALVPQAVRQAVKDLLVQAPLPRSHNTRPSGAAIAAPQIDADEIPCEDGWSHSSDRSCD